MKKSLILIFPIMFLLTGFSSCLEKKFATNAQENSEKIAEATVTQKESTYRKTAKLIDSIVKKTKPTAEKILENVVEDTVQSMQDFADDLNAPKEEQSSFAKAFNFIADAHPEDNMGAHEKGEPVPDGIFVNGKMGSHEDLLSGE